MADKPLRVVEPGEQCPPGSTCIPIIDLTQLVGDAYMQADLLRATALELEQARDRCRDAANHIEQLASALDGLR